MSMQLSIFQASSGHKQGRKSPLNILVNLVIHHAMAIFLDLLLPKESLKSRYFIIYDTVNHTFAKSNKDLNARLSWINSS